MIKNIKSNSDLKKSRSKMINSQILLQEFIINKLQKSTNESINKLISKSISEKTRISIKSNKKIFILMKFKDKNFDKKSK